MHRQRWVSQSTFSWENSRWGKDLSARNWRKTVRGGLLLILNGNILAPFCPHCAAAGTLLSLTTAGGASQAASNSRAGSYRCHRGWGQAGWPWGICTVNIHSYVTIPSADNEGSFICLPLTVLHWKGIPQVSHKRPHGFYRSTFMCIVWQEADGERV